MIRILTLLAILVIPGLFDTALAKSPLRAGTFEVTNSFNRRAQAEKGKMPAQRMWVHSAVAVADAIIDSDCDILGIHDVCDSIAGRREGVKPLIDYIRERGGDYDWLVLSNSNPNYPLEGDMANGDGIIWRSSRFELRDYGINWLSGIYDKPGRDKSLKYGGPKASFTWVRLYDKTCGKELVFASATVNGPNQYDHGEKVVYHEINVANCRNLINMLKDEIVPKGMPSIIAINSHNAPSHEGYKVLTSSVWFDVHDTLHEEGSLDEASNKVKDTCNSPDESKLQGGRPDHILVDGFDIVSYAVLRKKFATNDGSLHYPALHFPVVADLKL
ncbi:MAG: hypothetical protein IJQ52_04410 [Bacteroidales bacterium]|nr:hypothetical protein [Bacteroidales bacterium]